MVLSVIADSLTLLCSATTKVLWNLWKRLDYRGGKQQQNGQKAIHFKSDNIYENIGFDNRDMKINAY